MNEHRTVDRAHSTWPGVLCIWVEWFLELHAGVVASRTGRPVLEPTRAVTLRSLCLCASSRGWRASAGKPLCATGTCGSRPCDREHLTVSSVHVSEWPAIGDPGRNFV